MIDSPAPRRGDGRVVADGAFLSLNGRPFRARGTTYGSFRARGDGALFPETDRIEHDLAAMCALGLNTVRTYTLPPPDLLDLAQGYGLRLLVGLDYHDWRTEPHTGRAARRRILDAGRRAVDEALRRCAGRSHVLAVAVGNEVPVDLVRLHGTRAVADALSALVRRVHDGDPGLPATYVNFPTTEFLRVEGADLACFNVFLEDAARFRAYLASLQVGNAGRPLLVTELGLAGSVHGEAAQARLLDEQLQVIDELGVAGATVFSWTDEWAVAGNPVDGWGFGVTTAERKPKTAAGSLRGWTARSSPTDLRTTWPAFSVVVCAYDEERTLDACLRSLAGLDYPAFEVIVCDDGSTDATAEIARRHPVRLLELPHGGLSRARNAGVAAAVGDLVAFLDADATCHPDWLTHLATAFDDSDVVAAGGPNLAYPHAGRMERAVAASPGNPCEVLLGSRRAEHVAGCNMAFRRTALLDVGGFDAVYTAAGDDVDLCWRLLDRGGQIGFSASAQVHHHRRGSLTGYLRQQRGYGRAERLLARAHPHRFNRLGQARWSGRVYAPARLLPRLLLPRVYTGVAGSAPYQPAEGDRAAEAAVWGAALLPITVPVLFVSTGAAFAWPPALAVAPALLAAVAAYAAAIAASTPHPAGGRLSWRERVLVGLLHVLQPPVRAWGRIAVGPAAPGPEPDHAWAGDRLAWLSALRVDLARRGIASRLGVGGTWWDLEARRAGLVLARVNTAVAWSWEPRHRVRYRPTVAAHAAMLIILAGGLFVPALYAAAAALAAGTLVAAASLRRRLRRSLTRTTTGADTGPSG
jgi:GT2 family glycosyltransferase